SDACEEPPPPPGSLPPRSDVWRTTSHSFRRRLRPRSRSSRSLAPPCDADATRLGRCPRKFNARSSRERAMLGRGSTAEIEAPPQVRYDHRMLIHSVYFWFKP